MFLHSTKVHGKQTRIKLENRHKNAGRGHDNEDKENKASNSTQLNCFSSGKPRATVNKNGQIKDKCKNCPDESENA